MNKTYIYKEELVFFTGSQKELDKFLADNEHLKGEATIDEIKRCSKLKKEFDRKIIKKKCNNDLSEILVDILIANENVLIIPENVKDKWNSIKSEFESNKEIL